MVNEAKTRDLINIVIAEDDDDDYELTASAFFDANLTYPILRFNNGLDLLNHLNNAILLKAPEDKPPRMILILDLNLPILSGLEALKQIRTNPRLIAMPIIVLTCNQSEKLKNEIASIGVQSIISKPETPEEYIQIVNLIKTFWLNTALIPDFD